MPKTHHEGLSKKTVRGMDAEGRAPMDGLVACFRLHHSLCRKFAFCLNLIATASSINQTRCESFPGSSTTASLLLTVCFIERAFAFIIKSSGLFFFCYLKT